MLNANKPLSKVLVVDDDSQLCRLACRALNHEAYSVKSATSSAAALESLEQDLDIAVLDIYLGSTSCGLDLAREIRSRTSADVIVITGQMDVETAIRAMREGAYDYLLKPFGMDELVLALGRCTDKRRLSADLARERALQRRLAEEIAHRERLEHQVRQAHKMEAIGRLSSMLAHDFNCYLSVILGSASDMLNNERGSGAREDIQQIVKASKDAAALTRQILAFAKKERPAAGERDAASIVNLNDLVVEMRCLLSRAATKRIEIKFRLAPSLPNIRIDPVQLRQVLVNLVVNARDAMPGGGAVSISTAEVELDEERTSMYPDVRPGLHVMLQVSDSGCGMSKEVLDRVFEPYFTTKGPGKGTGLGLPIVYGIVRQSGGCIELESEVGEGATFRLFFPPAGAASGTAPGSGPE